MENTALKKDRSPPEKASESRKHIFSRARKPKDKRQIQIQRKEFNIMRYSAVEVANELNNRGYNAEVKEVVKNGVIFEGISIREEGSNIAPTIYTEEIFERAEQTDATFEGVVSMIEDIYKANRKPDIDVDFVKDKEYVLSHMCIGLQKDSTEELVKRPSGFDGIEKYLYIKVDMGADKGRVKLNEKILEVAGITEDEAWKSAEENLHSQTVVTPLFDMVAQMTGGLDIPTPSDDMGLFVMTNKENVYGASAILDKKALEDISERCGADEFFVIPSSTHEVILIADRGFEDIDTLTRMVKEVNATDYRY